MPILLQINSVVNYGSTGKIAEEIGQIAIGNGWNSYIAYGRNVRTSKSNLIKIGSDIDVKLHGLQTRLFDRHGLGSHYATMKFVEQVEKIKPDIIHLHNLHGYYLNINILFQYLKNKNIPVVWTFHDCWPITGHCTHFDFIGCEKWIKDCYNCPQKTEYPASFGLDRSRKNHQLKKTLFTSVQNMTIVTVSNWLYLTVKQSFLKDLPIQIINNGIDTNSFIPTKSISFNISNEVIGKFVILGVANIWSDRKGLQDFIELSSLIDEKSIIILVGLSPNQKRNLPRNIIGITRTENKNDLRDLYSLADVYVNTSVEETFGLITAEALSCGTPAIVYNATACPEVISPETGFVIEKGNIKELLKAIGQIKKIGKKHYTKSCRERARTMFDKNERNLDYLNLYESLLKH